MPWTAALFGVAALGAAALPVTGGFVAEWVLLQSLIAGVEPDDRLVAVALPLAVTAVALTAGLALLTFAKSYGIAFLALPRSEAAEHAHESGPTMRASMLVGAVAVVALGLVPGAYVGALADAVGADGVEGSAAGGIDLTALGASINPVALTLLAAALAVPVAVAVLVVRRAVPRRRTALAWGCGGARTSPRMQYNATSYAEPLVRVFDDMLSPNRDVEVTHADESRYLVERIEYRQQVVDAVEVGVYRPVLRGAASVGERARGLQNGSLHRYLGYSFAALLVVLVVVAL
jgi:NADH:ubiquinone oxidoreductase subunit 5 (subunit L)/multisubunit Na+/H+ antiporter MnhA subunit